MKRRENNNAHRCAPGGVWAMWILCCALFAAFVGVVAFMPQTANAAACQPGEQRLRLTGLCPGEAVRLMPPKNPDYAEGLAIFGCKAVVNESSFFEGALLYYAAQCKGEPVKLEAGAGAHRAGLSVIAGGMNEAPFDPYELVIVLQSDPANPTESLERWTREVMKGDGFDAAAIARCKARKVEGFRDFWVVDEYGADNLPPPSSDGPRFACGQYGLNEDSSAYWRIAHGYAWYADMGQEAYADIDFGSLTVIDRNDNGDWVPVQAQAAAPQPASATQNDNYGVTNVANAPGATETLYGETRGWTVYAGNIDGAPKYCVGERDYDGTLLRIGYDGGQWQFAVPYPVAPDYSGQFEVDGRVEGMSGTADGKWTFAWVGLPELDAIRNGNLMILDIGRASLDFELIGTAAVITKVEECVGRLKG